MGQLIMILAPCSSLLFVVLWGLDSHLDLSFFAGRSSGGHRALTSLTVCGLFRYRQFMVGLAPSSNTWIPQARAPPLLLAAAALRPRFAIHRAQAGLEIHTASTKSILYPHYPREGRPARQR